MPEEIEDLPGFAPTPERGPDPLGPETVVTPGAGQPQNPNPVRPKVSGAGEQSAPGGSPPRSTSSTSSKVSSDEVDEALAGYGASGFMLATAGLNQVLSRRARQPTTRWLATEDETQRFGEAMGRIAGRRVPDEVLDSGDAVDYLIMGEVVLTYGLRTLLNLTPDEAAAAGEAYIEAQAREKAEQPDPQGPQYGTPPPAAPAPRAVPTDDGTETQNHFGAVAPTPAPPSVIAPTI